MKSVFCTYILKRKIAIRCGVRNHTPKPSWDDSKLLGYYEGVDKYDLYAILSSSTIPVFLGTGEKNMSMSSGANCCHCGERVTSRDVLCPNCDENPLRAPKRTKPQGTRRPKRLSLAKEYTGKMRRALQQLNAV